MGIRHRGESKASYLGERNTRSFTTERAGHPDGNLEGGGECGMRQTKERVSTVCFIARRSR